MQTNLETSLSPRDASIAEKVAPEPLDSTEFVLSTEGTVIDFEEPGFQVSFQVDNGQTEVTVMGAEQEMLLFDITFAFNETGVRSTHTFCFNPPLVGMWSWQIIYVLAY